MDKKYRILVVEEDPVLLDAVEYMVSHAGYQTLSARDAEAALEIFRKEGPDLLIINPAVKGVRQSTLYQELKKSSGIFDVPVIVLPPAGFPEEDFSVRHTVIRPPVKDKKLIAAIADLLTAAYRFEKVPSGKKALLAVEHRDVLTVMSDQLQKLGWETEVTASGLYVVSQAVAFEPDLIILDVELSEFRPQDSIRILRTFLQFKDTPVLLFTSFHLSHLGVEDLYQKTAEIDSLRRQCLAAGATEYIGKFNEHSFLKLVRNYIRP